MRGRQRIDVDSHGAQLDGGDLPILFGGDGIHRRVPPAAVLGQGHHAQKLIRERHVHHFRRMSLRGYQIDQPALGEQVDAPSVGNNILLVVGAHLGRRPRHRLQIVKVQFAVVVARIADYRAILHHREVAARDHVAHAGRGNEHLAESRSFRHGQHLESVQVAFRAAIGSTSVITTRAPMPRARVAVPRPQWPEPRYHQRLAGQQDRGGAQDAVEGRLSGAVYIVEVPLRFRIVHGDHRVQQLAVVGHRLQALDAGGGFLGAAADPARQLGKARMDTEDEIRAVVEGQRRPALQRGVDAPVELVDRQPVPGEDADPFRGQRGGHVILGGQRIAARPRDLGARRAQRTDQHRGLFGDMQAARDALSGQRPAGLVAALQVGHDRHPRLRPADLESAPIGQGRISNLVFCHGNYTPL